MIDLRKPLEGVPGLLLLAALIFFGATIGVSLALMFSWVEMKDSVANFLGGVVGAGLGAVIAIMGAVYIYTRERRDRLTAPLNESQHRIRLLMNALDSLRLALLIGVTDAEFPKRVQDLLAVVEDALINVPESSELPPALHGLIAGLRLTLPLLLRSSKNVGKLEGDPAETRKTAIDETNMAKDMVRDILERIELFRDQGVVIP